MIVITADGKVSEVAYHGDIAEIYKAIGCELLDIVRLDDNLLMFVNDEGLMRNLEDDGQPKWNWKATYLRLIQWMSNPQDIDWTVARRIAPPTIAGTVCILSADDNSGDTHDLDDAEREIVLERLGESVMPKEESAPQGKAAKLPDGWKMYDKYQIRHTDGTPLKGKQYFVLRLDSDDEGEAGRVAAAMSAYKGETPQGNIAKMREVLCGARAMAVGSVNCGGGEPWNRLVEEIDAALAAKPRVCDTFSAKDLKMIVYSEMGRHCMEGRLSKDDLEMVKAVSDSVIDGVYSEMKEA